MDTSVDVCIVGTGFAGLLLAQKLIARQLKVALLESGVDGSANGPLSENQFCYLFHPDTVPGYVLTTKHRWIGGHSNCWGGICVRMPPALFAGQTTEGPCTPWPPSYADLEPFYEEAERILCPAVPPGPKAQALSTGERIRIALGARAGFRAAFRRLGTRFSGRANYIRQFSEVVHQSDRFVLKETVRSQLRLDQAILPELARSRYLQFLRGATALSVKMEARSRARAVQIRLEDGTQKSIVARCIVLACGGLETPRLLLLSRSEHYPAGIGNDTGNVGRYLSDHFTVTARASGSGPLPYSFDDSEFRWTRHWSRPDVYHRFFVLGSGTSDEFIDVVSGGIEWTNRSPFQLTPAHGKHVYLHLLAGLEARAENCLRLDEGKVDWTGRPAGLLRLTPSEGDWRLLDEMKRFAERTFGMMQLRNVEFAKGNFDVARMSGGHLLCACRMGDDPRHSVVDRNLRVHGIENLFLSGGATFTTVGAENPTLTISALTLRLADYLVSEAGLRSLPE